MLDLTQVGHLVVGADNFKGMITLHGENYNPDRKGEAATLVTSDLTASADIFGGGGPLTLNISGAGSLRYAF